MATCTVEIPGEGRVPVPENKAHKVQTFLRAAGRPFRSRNELTQFLVGVIPKDVAPQLGQVSSVGS